MATLARIENVDFRGPMFIGEMAVVCANVVFTSPHSLLVHVRLHAENILKGNCLVGDDSRPYFNLHHMYMYVNSNT